MDLAKAYSFVKYNNDRDYPQMITWDITNKCNMRCKHCFNQSGDENVYDFSQEIDDERTMALAKEIAEMKPKQVCLCGGETLLNKNLYEIIKIISSEGIMVNMVSNGLLMTNEVAEKLKSSGIYHVQISVDGLGYQHDEFRNMKGAFKRAINAIDILGKHDITIMVSYCPNKLNYKTFNQYVEYISTTKALSIRMMPLLPLGRGKINYDHLLLNSKELFEFIYNLERLRKEYPKIIFEWGDPLEHLHLVRMSNRKYPIVMGISSNGNLTATPYLPVVVGNIKEKTLKESWMSGYNRLWSNKQLYSIIRQVDVVYDLPQFNEEITINLE